MSLHPWQREAWARLWPRLQADRLPHGLLITGPEGIGKLDFAEALAQAALCQRPGPEGACGRCPTCVLYAAGTHPDLLRVAPEEDSRQIKVDQIRELIEFAALSRHYDGHKVILIHPAEAMNPNAANSLLKTLEEPTPRVVLVLVSARPSLLPATVRSRCQQLALGLPERRQALAWLMKQGVGGDKDKEKEKEKAAVLLAMAHGAPLKARDLARSEALERRAEFFKALSDLYAGRSGVVATAERWYKQDLAELLEWQIGWLEDAVRLRLAGPQARVVNLDLIQDLRRLAESLDLETLFWLRERLVERRLLPSTTVNRQLLLEDVLLGWLEARDRRRASA